MTLPDENPYASPATIASPIEDRTSSGPPVETRTSNGSPALSIVSAVGAVMYLAFTTLLLSSTAGDRMAGWMFLGNLPILIGLSVSIARSQKKGAYFAVTAACIQIGIALVFLPSPRVNVQNVVKITAVIVLPLLAIASIAWQSSRRST